MIQILRETREVSYPFYPLVPKERIANLEYRKDLYTRCLKDKAFREATWIACKRDTLFFFNAFLWVYEPRPGMPCGTGKIPFITWPHQDRAIYVLDANWGLNDVKFWKTRGEGVTWMACSRCMKDWLFDDPWNPGAFGLVTRNEETVDSPDDPDSLMWKCDWIIKQLPSWMVPSSNEFNRKVSEHSLKNYKNDATIIGYSASEDVGSGGRKRVFVLDELAKFGVQRRGADEAAMTSTLSVTNCRVVISTPKGTANAYYRCILEDVDIERYNVTERPLSEDDHRELNDKGVIVLHWSDNPIRNRGLFFVEKDGSIRPVDKEKYGDIPEAYARAWPDIRRELEKRGYKVVGTMRSPWYDAQCLRANATPQAIAQELDLDFGGSGYTIFKRATSVANKTATVPLAEYEVDYDTATLEPEMVEHGGGRLKVWQRFPHGGGPPLDEEYVVGADIASGLGGSTHSNSVLQILGKRTGTQVAEWADNATEPYDFADVAIAVAKFYGNAMIVHEANGPYGKYFTKRVQDRGYHNLYRRKEYAKSREKRTKEFGWGSQQETKPAMLKDLARKIAQQIITIRSKALVDELKEWVMQDGRIVHAQAQKTTDESSKGAAHGDRVVAMGVAALLCDPSSASPQEESEEQLMSRIMPHPESMAALLAEYDKSLLKGREIDW